MRFLPSPLTQPDRGPSRELSTFGLLALVVLAWLVPVVAIPNTQDREEQRLMLLLKDGDHFKVRVQAARALGVRRALGALRALQESLEGDPDETVRAASAWALGALNHPGALHCLHRAAESSSELVREQAGKAMAHILQGFPGNLENPDRPQLYVEFSRLENRARWLPQLRTYLLHHLASQLVLLEGVDLGETMDLRGENPEPESIPSWALPLNLVLKGGILSLTMPENRAAGDVVVELELTGVLEPFGARVWGPARMTGSAPFAGGAKSDDPWEEDPLETVLESTVQAACDDLMSDFKVAFRFSPTPPTPGQKERPR